MNRALQLLAVACWMGLVGGHPAASEVRESSASEMEQLGRLLKPKSSYSDQELHAILRDMGYVNVRIVKEGHLRLKSQGSWLALFRYADGDLQMTYGVTGANCGYSEMNRWNRSKRLSRAYLDGDGDPVLESDLPVGAGVGSRHIEEFINVFTQSVTGFRLHILKTCNSGCEEGGESDAVFRQRELSV